MLWAQDVDKLVFPTVLSSLQTYSYSCEGEEDEFQHIPPHAQAKSSHAGPQSISQLMIHKGSTGFSRNQLSTNRPATPPVLPTYSSDEKDVVTGVPMDEVGAASASSVTPPFHKFTTRLSDRNVDETDTENRMNNGATPGATHEIRPTSSGSLGIVTEETPSQATSPRPTEARQSTQLIGLQTTPKVRRQLLSAARVSRTSHSPLDHKSLSLDSTPPPPISTGLKEFFSSHSLFTRKLRGRSASVSSTTSNVSAGTCSVKSGGNTSDDGSRVGTKFIRGGIVLPRSGAAVAVSTESTIEGLEDAERRRQRRLRRERDSP